MSGRESTHCYYEEKRYVFLNAVFPQLFQNAVQVGFGEIQAGEMSNAFCLAGVLNVGCNANRILAICSATSSVSHADKVWFQVLQSVQCPINDARLRSGLWRKNFKGECRLIWRAHTVPPVRHKLDVPDSEWFPCRLWFSDRSPD